MIGVLHTARINAIEFIVSSDKLMKMVNELSEMTLLSMSSRSSVDREPARCSRGHGFDPHRRICWKVPEKARKWERGW